MFHPDDETLAGLALGEDVVLGDDEHVRSCGECSATIESIRQTAQLVRSGSRATPLVAPPSHVWSRIEEELGATRVAPSLLAAAAEPAAQTEPAQGQAGTVRPLRGTGARERRRAWRLPLGWGAGLTAAGLAIGLLTGRLLWQGPAATSVTPPATIATAELDTLDTRQRLGEAALLRTADGVDLRVATSPLDPGQGYLEVWLINTDGKRMVSIGILRGDAPETFPVSQALIDQGYVVVDISREGFDDRPEHSGDSLARGTLPA